MPTPESFLKRGVMLHNPATITLDVRPEQIAPGVEIFPCCRIAGESTSIGPGCRIGTDGPVVVEECQLGANVTFASGFAAQATFLDDVVIGANAHVRPGTLVEEQASFAHGVGLKQTLLMPFVTLGSLINFCDCLMSGGTGRTNHSEVGSAFVHFNFTPRQDKATPSLFGDVPNGVLLDQPPIFLGGQGGVVGPVRMAYGTVQAAGDICRRDVLTPGLLIHPPAPEIPENTLFDPCLFGNLERTVRNNCIYIGNLHALVAWYRLVRRHTMPGDPFAQACHRGALERLQQMVEERIRQLAKVAGCVPGSPVFHPSHTRLTRLMQTQDLSIPDALPDPPGILASYLADASPVSHVSCIQSMPPECRVASRDWLQAIVDNLETKWEETIHE